MARKHRAFIVSDQPIQVLIEGETNGAWFKVFHNVVRGGYLKDMTPGACKVLLALSHHQTKENGLLVWPSVGTLAKETGLTERCVFTAVKWLEDHHMLRRMSPGKHEVGRRSNRYLITTPPIPGERTKNTPAPAFIPELGPNGRPLQADSPPNNSSVKTDAGPPESPRHEHNKADQELRNKRAASLEERNKTEERRTADAVLREMPDDVLQAIKQQIVNELPADSPSRRAMERADPRTGLGLSLMIYKRLVGNQQETT